MKYLLSLTLGFFCVKDIRIKEDLHNVLWQILLVQNPQELSNRAYKNYTRKWEVFGRKCWGIGRELSMWMYLFLLVFFFKSGKISLIQRLISVNTGKKQSCHCQQIAMHWQYEKADLRSLLWFIWKEGLELATLISQGSST